VHPTYPSYLKLHQSGELARRAERAVAMLAECTLCARKCRVDRLHDPELHAHCHTGRRAILSSAFPHHGEEDCLRGTRGSGTIFFCQCNLRCEFCQNCDISYTDSGRKVTPDELAEVMLRLQGLGCHNVNFVTPSHVVAQILEALVPAVEGGLNLPLVYNTGGYDRVETLELLDGVFDVYMPDVKFADPTTAKELARARDYFDVAKAAVREMHRQVGDLELDDRGIARRGLLVRHLVMPEGLDETRQIMRFLAREISRDTFVNVMPQYRPSARAAAHPKINRPITLDEYHEALAIAEEEGLWRLDRRR